MDVAYRESVSHNLWAFARHVFLVCLHALQLIASMSNTPPSVVPRLIQTIAGFRRLKNRFFAEAKIFGLAQKTLKESQQDLNATVSLPGWRQRVLPSRTACQSIGNLKLALRQGVDSALKVFGWRMSKKRLASGHSSCLYVLAASTCRPGRQAARRRTTIQDR